MDIKLSKTSQENILREAIEKASTIRKLSKFLKFQNLQFTDTKIANQCPKIDLKK